MTQQYQELTEQLAALVDAEWPMVSNLANAAALLYERLDRLNWAGFYLTDNHVLWLGQLFREKQRACGLQRETASAGQRCRRTAYSGSRTCMRFPDILRATRHPGRKLCFHCTKTER